MADKGDYHLQKVGFTTPRGERVQVTHQQNTVGFLYGLLTSTKPGTCVPSLQAERVETLPEKWQLFLLRLHLSVTEYKYGPCVCVFAWAHTAHVCAHIPVCE